jgi:hypothetical protein
MLGGGFPGGRLPRGLQEACSRHASRRLPGCFQKASRRLGLKRVAKGLPGALQEACKKLPEKAGRRLARGFHLCTSLPGGIQANRLPGGGPLCNTRV